MEAERSYHHGNLREAFLDAARRLLERDGLTGLSLRKCAEVVGVSHTAPKNHFGNMAGLLTAIVTQGYSELAQMMTADLPADADRDRRRKTALLGYIAFAEQNPSLYELMFSRDRFVNDDPDLMRQVGACFVVLADISTGLGWHQGTVDEMNGKGQVALWSLVHGYAQLVTAGRFKKDNMKGLSILDILPALGVDQND
ncbi:TetR/AcrR family transcriptional regulator [Thalassococcus lentus]|uniref:TetR/AcrR family transcriptional regulator n=1 Tax=Thalassococcus lentus TaxID=1210524 RepID=A0ABT4XPM1_9RHOB|nr:TetR/AcrR family transcriptional regulator [Thalassococcus lentus]MDA7423903.1 TetR/AcrR family transcriptional regulator [Thalassococcus lentus]